MSVVNNERRAEVMYGAYFEALQGAPPAVPPPVPWVDLPPLRRVGWSMAAAAVGENFPIEHCYDAFRMTARLGETPLASWDTLLDEQKAAWEKAREAGLRWKAPTLS